MPRRNRPSRLYGLRGRCESSSRKREKQHIPGLAFVVVTTTRFCLGDTRYTRSDRKLPVTPDTVFPIGSCTKSFTSAPPRRVTTKACSLWTIPAQVSSDFRMADPEADAPITFAMLCHRTGLCGKPSRPLSQRSSSREEYVRAATSAKPRRRCAEVPVFQRHVHRGRRGDRKGDQMTLRRLIETTISAAAHDLEPHFGGASRRVVGARARVWLSRGFQGLEARAAAEKPRRDGRRPVRSLPPPATCPMASLPHGGWNDRGKRLVSEATLQEIARPHIAINDTLSYGLGWATYKWNGHTVVEHDGGSQGMSALVELRAGPTRRIRLPFQRRPTT